jgi:hypothetical protein
MLTDTIFSRTRKGDEILQGDRQAITHDLRRALLAIDGKTSVANLVKSVFWVKNLDDVLRELYTLGYIDCGDFNIVNDGTGAKLSAEDETSMKVQLVALAWEMLGKNAERMIKKFEETNGSPDALEQVLLACGKIIKLTISQPLAETFVQRGRKIIGK